MSEALARLIHDTQEKLKVQLGLQPEPWPFDDFTLQEKTLLVTAADQVEMQFFGSGADETLSDEFYVENGYGVNTQQPFVALTYNGRKIVQMAPENAIALAHSLLTAAEASISDAFLIRFFLDVIQSDEPRTYYVIQEFRKFREERDAQNGDV